MKKVKCFAERTGLQDIGKILENLYLLIVAICVLKRSLETTMFSVVWPNNFEWHLYIASCAVVLLKLGYSQAYKRAEWIFCVLTFILFGLSWSSTGYVFLLEIPILMIGAVGVPFKKILKTEFWVGLFVLLIAMLGSFSGVVRDLVYLQRGVYKHAFGIVYTTDFAAHVFFLLCTGWVLYSEALQLWFVLLAIAVDVFVYRYVQARNSTILIGLLAVGMVYVWTTEKIALKERKIIGRLCSVLEHVLCFSFAIAATAMLALTFAFARGQSLAVKLDSLISSRLWLGSEAIKNYGITYFGTPFDMVGSGGNELFHSGYNFVDSTYILLAVRYGALILIVSGILWWLASRKALKNGQKTMLIALSLIALHSTSEHHFIEIAYNAFLLVPFADLSGKYQQPVFSVKAKKMRFCYTAAAIVLSILCFPIFVMCIRTAAHSFSMATTNWHRCFIGGMTVLLLTLLLLFRSGREVLSKIVEKNTVPKRRVIGLCSVCLALCLIGISGIFILTKGKEKYDNAIEQEFRIIDALSKEQKINGIYVDTLPLFYQKEFSNISFSVFREEGMVEKDNIVLITGKERELQTLFDKGFYFAEISSEHAIYTNSECAMTVLQQMGMPVTYYNSAVHEVELEKMAQYNGLELTEQGTIHLQGRAQSIYHGPWETIYRGSVKVTYNIKVESYDILGPIATMRFAGESGNYLIQEVSLSYEDLTPDGRVALNVTGYIPYNMEGIEFLLFLEDGVELDVESITWQKVVE